MLGFVGEVQARPMKITILQGAFLPVPPLKGGAVEKMWFELGAEFAARGHTVTHVSRRFGTLPHEEVLRGVNHLRVRGAERSRNTKRNMLPDLLYSWRAARRMPSADVVVTNTFWAPVVLGRRHGAIYVDVQRMPKGQMRLYRRAARLRANSTAVSTAIIAEVPHLAERVNMIPNPLPFVPTRPVDWARKTKAVLFVGRIHPEKGIALLLEAWTKLRQAGSLDGWRLELVGPTKESEGGGGEAWVNTLRQKFPRPDIVWHAPVNDTAVLNAFYEQAAVFAYPSLAVKGETFGLAVLEAMAWGTVSVVSELACFHDFVVEQRNGLFFDHASPEAVAGLGDALCRAARPESRTLAEQGVHVRESHSCSSIATQFLEDFTRLIS